MSSHGRQGGRRSAPSRRRSGGPADSDRPEQAGAPCAAEKPSVHPGEAARQKGRGRHAEKPSAIPKAGWLDVLARTKQQLEEDNLPIVAAGVAFYGFVAVVPALAATIGIYGLVANPQQAMQQITAMADILPREVMPMLHEQMTRITSNTQTASFSAILGVLLAVYSSAVAMKAMIKGLNIAYDERERRNFFKLTLFAMGLTLGAIVAVVLAVGLVAVLPSVLGFLDLATGTETVLNLLRWPLLMGGFMIALAVLYRFGPCRKDAKWRWVSPGAIAAAVLWVIGSIAFSLYVTKVASYDKTYGSLGAVVVFLMWLFISAFAVLLGAELNAELERQTRKDSTNDPAEPLGDRGAMAADTVGPTREELRPPKKK